MEVLIAVSILGVIGASVLTALEANSRSTRTLDEKVVATNLATAYFEVIKKLPFASSYPNAGENITVPQQYTVDIETECSSDGTNFVPCTGSDNETFQRIRFSVLREEGRPVLSICTYKTKR
jgi:type II secretory pathway pseudopilin PulG